MTQTLKSNDNKIGGDVVLPLAPENIKADSDMEIYVRFMRHYRMVPNSRLDIKVLSAIQFTADILDIGDALIAKTLVDLGLRAPRRAFPSDYLEFIDNAVLRSGWEVGGPTKSAAELKLYWDKIGEDKFAAHRREPVTVCEPMFLETT